MNFKINLSSSEKKKVGGGLDRDIASLFFLF